MNCSTARSLLALYRPGERTSAEEETLKEHVRSCPDCALEFRMQNRSAREVEELRGLSPVLDDPAEFTRSVFSAIDLQLSEDRSSFFTVILRPAERFSLQFAVVTAVIFVVGGLFFQLSDTLLRVHRLEQQYGITSTTDRQAEIALTVNARAFVVSEQERIQLRSAGIAERPTGLFVVPFQTLRAVQPSIAGPLSQRGISLGMVTQSIIPTIEIRPRS